MFACRFTIAVLTVVLLKRHLNLTEICGSAHYTVEVMWSRLERLDQTSRDVVLNFSSLTGAGGTDVSVSSRSRLRLETLTSRSPHHIRLIHNHVR